MKFLWPTMLLTLLLVPLLAGAYWYTHRRRRALAARNGSFGFLQAGPGHGPGVRLHIPPALFLASLAAMTFALARPQFVVSLPRVEGTVILVFDVSGSMAAEDIQPTRLEAAKAAALGFVEKQPATVQIGVVAFSDGGLSVVAPTNEQDKVIAAINRLSPERGTSLANGILSALDLIARSNGQANSDQPGLSRPEAPVAPAVPTDRPSAVIVLLTDGENNMAPSPIEAAGKAAELGVRVDTIGVGSPEGITLHVNDFTVHTRLDEATLRQISQVSGGNYYNARDEADLRSIYEGIRPALVIKPDEMEVTSLFAGLGMLMLLVAGAFSLWWFGRVP